MKKIGLKRFLLVTCVLLFACAAHAEHYQYIDITNPATRKIPLAAPTFSPLSGTNAGAVAVEGTDVLRKTLDFTRYFTIIDPASYLWDPMKDDYTGVNVNYQNWVTVGADLVATAGVKTTSRGQVELDMRLLDVFRGQVVLSKKYTGPQSDVRTMVQQFCGEIMHYLTGSYGIIGSKIAFVSRQNVNVKNIYIAEFDGYKPRAIVHNGSINLTPAWASDGNRIAYTSFVEKGADIFVQSLAGNRQKIASYSGVNINPCWVPDKSELAISCSFTGDSEIYLLTATGKIIKRLTNSWGIDTSPTYSPDGSQMAFVSDRGGSPQIYIADVAGGNVRRLTFSGGYNTQPAWSPKGDKIAYTTMSGGGIDIYVIDVQTGFLMKLTEATGRNENPTWAPDASLIAFSSTRLGGPKIFTMTAYGMDQRLLLDLPGEQPAWSPGFTPK